jgi:hypothetical protein
MIAMALLAGAAVLAAFHCEAEAPRMVVEKQGQPAYAEIGLPPQANNRTFNVQINQGERIPEVKVDWPQDGMRLAVNVGPAFETAEGSYAFFGYSAGPCLFTDEACLNQFSIVDRGEGNGKADLLIVPAALTTDTATKKKMLMTVIMRGECQRTDLKK